MKLQSFETWDHLSEKDLAYNNVGDAVSSQLLGEIQERLRRKRHIGSTIADVRTAFSSCRPAVLRCSRHMRFSRTLCDAVLRDTQRLGTHILRPPPPMFRNRTPCR